MKDSEILTGDVKTEEQQEGRLKYRRSGKNRRVDWGCRGQTGQVWVTCQVCGVVDEAAHPSLLMEELRDMVLGDIS